MLNSKDKTIYDFCDTRWKYYIEKDGSYFPTKHDKLVLQEAADQFGITPQETKEAFDKVSKVKAEEEVKGMSKTQIMESMKKIVEMNAETPWGQEKRNKYKK